MKGHGTALNCYSSEAPIPPAPAPSSALDWTLRIHFQECEWFLPCWVSGTRHVLKVHYLWFELDQKHVAPLSTTFFRRASL